jgi:hypothetical protein
MTAQIGSCAAFDCGPEDWEFEPPWVRASASSTYDENRKIPSVLLGHFLATFAVQTQKWFRRETGLNLAEAVLCLHQRYPRKAPEFPTKARVR